MIVHAKDFGVKAQPTFDNTLAVKSALDFCNKHSDVTLVFPKGRYHFWPDKAFEQKLFISNHDQAGMRRIVFPMKHKNQMVIDGQGSEFIFHGEVIPFMIDTCANTRIKNIIIDWDEPMFGQGVVTTVNDNAFEIKVDDGKDYIVKDNQLFVKFAGKTESVWGLNEFSPETKAPAYQSGDKLTLNFHKPINIEKTKADTIKFYGADIQRPKCGHIVTMRFGRRENPAFFLNDSKNTSLQSIRIHHALGMGVIAQKCEDIVLDDVHVGLREKTNRYISATADATHFVYCRGDIVINNCLFENQLDDPCNVHGIYARITECVKDNQLLIKLVHDMAKGIQIASPGDQIGFVNRHSLLTYGKAVVTAVDMLNQDYLLFTFEQPLPEQLQINDVIENRSWVPNLIVTNTVVRSNRARGFLITTAGDVLLENNVISAPGSGIKISGDANSWFESGAVRKINIRNNRFLDCNYCCPDWGRAVIDIDPEIEQPEKYDRCYHQNIHIENNHFSTFDTGIVYGRSIDGFKFKNNTIETSQTYARHNFMTYPIQLEASRHVLIEENDWVDHTEDVAHIK